MRHSPALSSKRLLVKNIATLMHEPTIARGAIKKRSANWTAFWRALIALYNGVWSKR